MGFVFVPFYIRYLGIDGFGLVGVFAALQLWFGLLDMGMSVSLNRELARFSAGASSAAFVRDLLRSMEGVAASVALFIGLCVKFGSGWIAYRFLDTGDLPVLVVSESISIIGLVAGLRIIEGLYRSVLVGLQRQVLYNVISSFMATLRGAGALVVLAYVDSSLKAFFYWQLVSSVLTLTVLALVAYRILPAVGRRARFSKEVLWQIKGFAGGFLGFTFLNMVLSQVDKVLLMRLLDLGEYGYYTLAATAAGALNVLIGPVVQTYYPHLSALYAKGDLGDFAVTYHRGAQLVSVLFGTAAIFMTLMADILLRVWTQDADLAARVAPLLTVLALGNLLNGLMWVPFQAQFAAGQTRLLMISNLLAVAVIIPLIFWSVPRYGPIGAAWVWTLMNLGYVLILIHFIHCKILIGEKWRWYIQDVILPLSASSGVIFTLSRVLVFDNTGIIKGFAQLALISVIAFGAAIFTANQARSVLFIALKRRRLFRKEASEEQKK